MVSLALSLVALLGLGLLDWVPGWLETDNGLTSIEPGLLTVAPEASGIAVLGNGFTVSLYRSGFRYSRRGHLLADTVTRGAPVVAVLGRVDRSHDANGDLKLREHLTRTLPDVTITGLDLRPGLATYTGTVSGTTGERVYRLPLRWQVILSGGTLYTTVSVPGADALVISLDVQPNVRGIRPTLPARNLRRRSWWFAEGATAAPAFTWQLRSAVGLGPPDSPRAVDLSADGRIDLHAWAGTAWLVIAHRPGPDWESERYGHGI